MNGRMYGALAAMRGAHHEQASDDVWEIVRELEAALPPAQMRLVHQLRLAAELAGSLRTTATVSGPRGGHGTLRA